MTCQCLEMTSDLGKKMAAMQIAPCALCTCSAVNFVSAHQTSIVSDSSTRPINEGWSEFQETHHLNKLSPALVLRNLGIKKAFRNLC